MNDSVDQSSPSTSSAPEKPVPNAAPPGFFNRAWRNPWFLVALIALALASWQWIETRNRLSRTQTEVARRLSESDTVAKEARALSKQAQEQIAALQGKLGELEGKVAESKSQQATLENLYQDLARNRDEWVLAEIEQSVTLASQQLQLAGNVQGAVLALQAADVRLVGNNRPQFIGLRKILARDLNRLRALPQVDLPGMSLRLENVIAAVDTLPLAVDVRPREDAAASAVAETETAGSLAFWRRLGTQLWAELRGLVRIQRFDRDEPALLAPGQAFFLRENVKLRLLSARLALLGHDQWTFRSELQYAEAWIDRYFDSRERSVQNARGALTQLSNAEINIDLPTLNESLSAIKNFKLGKEPR